MSIKSRKDDCWEVTLDAGQRWRDTLNGEPDIIIDEVTHGDTHFHYDGDEPRSNWQRTHGVDGFIDFLDANGYELHEG